MRIDAHQHFWKYEPVKDSWITEEMSVIRRDFFPNDLAPELRKAKMDASIAVQAAQSEEETMFLLDLAERNPFIAGVVGWIDLRANNLRERLRYFSQFSKLRGFRHIAQSELDDRFLVKEDFLRGIDGLREFDFSYDILIYARQLPAAMELVSKFPEQRFVLDHLGKPSIKMKELHPWTEQIRRLATHPNVYCKVSGLVTEADHQRWQPADFRPYLDVVFEAFGISRLMFGSDWPVCLLAGQYAQVKSLIEDYCAGLSAHEKKLLFGEVAAQFYRIEDQLRGPAA